MHTQLGRLRQAYAEDAPNFVLCVFQPTLGQLHRHSSKDALQADRSRTANVEQKKPLMERRSCSCRRERIYSYSYSLPDCCVQAGTERQEQPKRPKPTLPWEHRRRCKGSPALRACHSPGSPSSQCKASSSQAVTCQRQRNPQPQPQRPGKGNNLESLYSHGQRAKRLIRLAGASALLARVAFFCDHAQVPGAGTGCWFRPPEWWIAPELRKLPVHPRGRFLSFAASVALLGIPW